MEEIKDFWQTHSMRYLEMAFRSDRRERIENPDGYGRNTGACGDTVEMFLTVRADIVRAVSFEVEGCLNTLACANAVAEHVEGKRADEAWQITADEIIRYLETLPPDAEHCAELAVGALYLALRNHLEFKNCPWKINYRRRG
jgi:nitrogen fixation NifU-like protein